MGTASVVRHILRGIRRMPWAAVLFRPGFSRMHTVDIRGHYCRTLWRSLLLPPNSVHRTSGSACRTLATDAPGCLNAVITTVKPVFRKGNKQNLDPSGIFFVPFGRRFSPSVAISRIKERARRASCFDRKEIQPGQKKVSCMKHGCAINLV